MEANNQRVEPIHISKTIRFVRAMLEQRTLIHAATIVFFVLLFSTLALTAPNYEWDLLAYIANAKQLLTELPIHELHAPIYADVMNSIPADSYAKLIGSPSRLVLSEDPEAFRQTIAYFYDARVVYIYILAGFMKLGINPVLASYVFSTACATLSAVLLCRLIPVKVPLGLIFVLPFIALSCGLLTVARLATPDALATLTTIVLYFLLIRNRVLLLLILLPMIVFIRTDLIVLTGLFYAYFFVFNRFSRFAIVASALVTVTAYFLLNYVIVEGDPWSGLIGYNFGDKPTHPNEFIFTVTMSEYFSYILQGLRSFSYNPIFFVFCMLAVTGIVLFSARVFYTHDETKMSQQNADILFLLISCVAYLGLHFLLFPVTWTRFFAAQYSLVAVVVVWTTLAILAERNHSTRHSMDLLNS